MGRFWYTVGEAVKRVFVVLGGKDTSGYARPILSTPAGRLLIASSQGLANDGASSTLAAFTGLSDNARPLAVAGFAFNGSGWDRFRANSQVTLLSSAARTSTTTSSDQTNHNARGVMAFMDVTAVPGVDTVELQIQVKDPVSGNYVTIVSTGAQSATGTYVVVAYPGASDGASLLSGVNGVPVPRTWRVRVVHSGTGSFTYSVGASYIL